ncbi:MAG: transposase [Clostridiales bacterium]|nr:transposase [Clostridiales bacterium]
MGIPITYQLFPGSTNDCLTFRPNLSQIQSEYNFGRVIVVADKGMTTGDNIYYTLSAKDGYVFSMSVRGAGKELKEYVLTKVYRHFCCKGIHASPKDIVNSPSHNSFIFHIWKLYSSLFEYLS